MGNVKKDELSDEFILTLPDKQKHVYLYMRDEYANLEEAGEKYDEAKNDELVENKAGEAFDISPEEAGNLYAQTESQWNMYMTKKASS
ncbi:hypothetical protein [Alteribacillus sp. HJP-4]|uniref:hypothetical protein n=1 Tax=Alteribacillus sp. HJP-4 TaxID=2775394 RepID=UPI0035CCF104